MVDRCVCFDKSFSVLKEIMIENKITTFEGLRQRIQFSDNCKLCTPYVKLMIKTGQTEFAPMQFREEEN